MLIYEKKCPLFESRVILSKEYSLAGRFEPDFVYSSSSFNIESEIVKNKENCMIEISNLNYIEFKKKD